MSNDRADHEVEIEVVMVDGGRSYRLIVDGEPSGELDVIETNNVRDLVHTGVRSHLSGQGMAARLLRRALDDARANHVLIRPSCSYAAAYLKRHPDDSDLLA